MIGQGLKPQLFEIIGYSEYQPVASNDRSRDRVLNRRVEIELIAG